MRDPKQNMQTSQRRGRGCREKEAGGGCHKGVRRNEFMRNAEALMGAGDGEEGEGIN